MVHLLVQLSKYINIFLRILVFQKNYSPVILMKLIQNKNNLILDM